MKDVNVLGIDLGASNGRGFIGRYNGIRLYIEEISRFANNPLYTEKGCYWNITELYGEILNMVRAVGNSYDQIASLAIDGWAQDFGLLDESGRLLDNPRHYRDKRTDGILEKISRDIPVYEIFKITGMNPTGIAALFQLISMQDGERDALEQARRLLFIPGLMNYFLTGIESCDLTMASVSHLYNCNSGQWDNSMLERFGLPDVLPSLNSPGRIMGPLSPTACMETGTCSIPVISVAGHDTASAVMAVTSSPEEGAAFISCGTWSLIGTCVSGPLLDINVYKSGFSNMAGYEKNMLIKCITGLWILQECEKEWMAEGFEVNYDILNECAEKNPFDSIIDPCSNEFLYPGHMCRKVADYCRRTGQASPDGIDEIYKCIIWGIALKHAEAVKDLQTLLGKPVKRIYMVGGGARNSYLCRMTADMSGIAVVAGPYEAAVTGNITAQLIALGELKDMDEARQLIQSSFALKCYDSGTLFWDRLKWTGGIA